MRVMGVIPARYQSSRLEGKPLADIHGKPMIQHVYERARQARCLDSVVVATDDPRIFEAVRGFGGEAMMTSASHRSGTDRVAEVARAGEADVIVNVQGDEPMLDPQMIEEIVAPFTQGIGAEFVTLKRETRDEAVWADPGVVKVVTDLAGWALYFSRSLVPYPRNRTARSRVFEHIGLYAYSRACLARLSALAPTPLEETESLEQLRALENGIRLYVVETECGRHSVAVDTPADLDEVRRLLAPVG
ncbi:MAG: 3-deoxy-manno-octulosonate cytidylyltransferase [Acidobacteria bacterium]|nr:3-deoxy-manno-octulosonate cytidylyltransferase [Acidobacteriota bacterium]